MDTNRETKRTKQRRFLRRAVPGLLLALSLLGFTTTPGMSQPAAVGGSPDRQRLAPDASEPARPDQELQLVMLNHGRRRGPQVDDSLPPVLKYQLGNAYHTAVKVLRKEAACRALFDPFGRDGETVLARTWYVDAGDGNRTCATGVPAFTTVGGTNIKLCRNFGHLKPATAAALLLHEALHSSGLQESPAYPDAMTAAGITAVVRKGCKLE